MGIKIHLKREENTIRADLDAAYLRILDVEILSQTGNVRIPFYVYADQDARNATFKKEIKNETFSLPPALPVKQGVEIVPSSEFAPAFFRELDTIRSEPGEMTDAAIMREAGFRTGYFFLKSRGYAGADC